jgi:hypothetical protein
VLLLLLLVFPNLDKEDNLELERLLLLFGRRTVAGLVPELWMPVSGVDFLNCGLDDDDLTDEDVDEAVDDDDDVDVVDDEDEDDDEVADDVEFN